MVLNDKGPQARRHMPYLVGAGMDVLAVLVKETDRES